ncbi:MAG: phosphatidate cytidylyltransferase, partial [candidate division WOR-3 bacterium]
VCISAFLLALFFPKKVAIISLLFLSISDNLASIVGKLFGKTKLFKNKTLEGFLAFLIVSFIITLFFQELSIKKKIIISLFASFVELFSGTIDDNFTVPLLTAILLYYVL